MKLVELIELDRTLRQRYCDADGRSASYIRCLLKVIKATEVDLKAVQFLLAQK